MADKILFPEIVFIGKSYYNNLDIDITNRYGGV